jgi:hypothetical protein
MNIFYLDPIASKAAQYHCDKHVGKMLIESCQMLATAHHMHGNGDNVSYKPTHVNHPSNVWVRSSVKHYHWLVQLAYNLGLEFERRYGKVHKSFSILAAELMNAPEAMYDMPHTWTPPTLAMPEEFYQNDTIKAYRNFYASKHGRMTMEYYKGNQQPPIWLTDIWNEEMSVKHHGDLEEMEELKYA